MVEASRRFALRSDPKAIEELSSLLYQMISRPPEMVLEIAFLAQFDSRIAAAGESLRTFPATDEILHFHSAWNRVLRHTRRWD
jgi:hypothetical protein